MANELTVIHWRDIPMQIVARGPDGASARALLTDRFQEAVDASAMVAGLIGSDEYTEQMRMDKRRAATTSTPRSRRRGLPSRPTGPTRSCARRSAPAATGTGRRRDRHRRQLGHARGRDRQRPPVRHHRRAHQPDRPQEARAGDEGRRLPHGDRRHARAGRGRRRHAGRERRHPARRRAGDPRRHDRARAVADRRAAVDRLVHRRRVGGRPRCVSGQGAREQRHRRGRADRAGAAARRQARRRRRRHHERRDRHQRGPRRPVRDRRRRSCRPPPTTASGPRTSSSTRS